MGLTGSGSGATSSTTPLSGFISPLPVVASSRLISLEAAFTLVATLLAAAFVVTLSNVSASLPSTRITSLNSSSGGESPLASSTTTLDPLGGRPERPMACAW